ncbi:hypothetical protein D4Z93_03145 [Clostridium fermenticellae]|uniref:Uncharacterized protein n=1 Tax=Clostridium fermenticellae TaxID=2068654 RepID=A0A386H1P1_9CLOT|nr:hypothetical protein [Clostridium fermenticellae]AYD39590.1 hypothetical protein D4Z93_03145 [Clostridium fermenticellae]
MKYIGPFLRMNKLKKENIENQLFHLCKESVKQISLYSRCGICTSSKKLKLNNLDNFDITTFKNLSPLLCIYRKANPKLINIDDELCWNDEKFKREINIDSTCFMTLCLMELSDYYSKFKDIDKNKYSLSQLYLKLCKKQLDFYATYLRNGDGVFVDKKDISDDCIDELKLEEKDKKFKFSSQALMMAAYYKYSKMSTDNDRSNYEEFAMDILNMFLEFNNELYTLSFEETLKLCLALNIFISYSKNEEGKMLLLDLCDLLDEKSQSNICTSKDTKLQYECLKYLNYTMFYMNTKISKFKDKCYNTFKSLIELYDPEKGIFIKHTEKKNITFSCLDVTLYLLTCLCYCNMNKLHEKSINLIIIDIFKHQIVESGIVLSWPNVPDINDVERYKNYSMKSEDLLDDENFKMPSISAPENCDLSPVFVKYVTYNRKKQMFKPSKNSFDSYKNMMIFFLISYLYNIKNKK